jgi:quercetin dioxygenase-like cupin family protein
MNLYTFVADVLTEIEIPEKGMLSHALFNDDNLKIMLFRFASGHELKAHTAPIPTTLYFVKGEAALTLGSETRDVNEGALIQMQPHVTHAVVAKTPVTMLLYMLKAAREK